MSGGIFFPPTLPNIDSNPRMKGCFWRTKVAATCRYLNDACRQNSKRLICRKRIQCQHYSERWNCGLSLCVCSCTSHRRATAKGSWSREGLKQSRLSCILHCILVSIKTFVLLIQICFNTLPQSVLTEDTTVKN